MMRRDARVPSILSIPDDVMELIAVQSAKMTRGTGDWCKLASCCKRLWQLQLPATVHTWSTPSTMKIEGELTSRMSISPLSIVHEVCAITRSWGTHMTHFCAGIAWTLQRQTSASWLGLHLHDASQLHTMQQFKCLDPTLKKVVKASQDLFNLSMLARPLSPRVPQLPFRGLLVMLTAHEWTWAPSDAMQLGHMSLA